MGAIPSMALSTNFTQNTAPPSAAMPNFPVSKQMDNQVNLLWERLSHLVETLSKADSLSEYNLALTGFNVDLLPFHEKNQIFAVHYEIEGIGDSGSCNPTDARVIDMFPSASTVNITSTRYNDMHAGVGAILSWFSLGLSASYTREHLKLSQSLGQSAYITGFSIGSSDFGWAFGKNLGDDSVTPGSRAVFAIVTILKSCKQFKISPVHPVGSTSPRKTGTNTPTISKRGASRSSPLPHASSSPFQSPMPAAPAPYPLKASRNLPILQ